jgi:hypothetical protein
MADITGRVTEETIQGSVDPTELSSTIEDLEITGVVQDETITGYVTEETITARLREVIELAKPAGINKSLQYNDNDVFGGIGGMLYDKDLDRLDIQTLLANTDPDNIVSLYVNGTTGDDSNDGSFASPFKTIERAVTELTKLININYVELNIADGTYEDTYINIHNTVRGNVTIRGNVLTPANVILKGSGLDSVINISSRQAESVTLAGFTIDDVGYNDTIYIGAGSITMYAVNILDGLGINAENCQLMLLSSPGASTLTFDINQPYSAGIYANNSFVDIDVNLIINNSYIGISSVNQSVVTQGITSTRNITITSAGDSYANAIQVYGGASYYCYGNITYDGKELTGQQSNAIEVGANANFFQSISATHNISNCKNAFFVNSGGQLTGITPTVNTTNVTNKYGLDYSALYSWNITPVFSKSDNYGFDERYSLITTGTSAPSSTPAKVGNIYVDTNNRDVYISVGTTNSGDWVKLN